MPELKAMKHRDTVFEDSGSESGLDEESDTEWKRKEEKRPIKTPNSERRIVSFSNEAETSISIDASIEEARDE